MFYIHRYFYVGFLYLLYNHITSQTAHRNNLHFCNVYVCYNVIAHSRNDWHVSITLIMKLMNKMISVILVKKTTTLIICVNCYIWKFHYEFFLEIHIMQTGLRHENNNHKNVAILSYCFGNLYAMSK